MTFFQRVVMAFGLLASFTLSIADAAPKLSLWEGRTTSNQCLKYKKAVKKAVKKANKTPSLEAGQMFILSAVNAYSKCLKKAFKAALNRKIKALKGKDLTIHKHFIISKKSLLDEDFVDALISSGHYLHTTRLKDAVLMAKVYFNRNAIEKATFQIDLAKTLSR